MHSLQRAESKNRPAGRQVQLQFDTRLILIQLALKRKKTPDSLAPGSQMQQQRSTTINKPGSGRSSNPDVRQYVCLRRSRPSKGVVRYLRYKKAKWAGRFLQAPGKGGGSCRKHVEAWDGSASCQHNAGGPFTACRLAGLFLATAVSPRNQLRIVQLTCHLALERTRIFRSYTKKVVAIVLRV